ncbi:MAG: TonB-dependent receptor [Acidobacteria bacterium]|nr:TonB-dependent receptor [Acidobacteriota bacterium]MCA1617461.1 TonB-dependent receptor [Acidobacteriota bacterium]
MSPFLGLLFAAASAGDPAIPSPPPRVSEEVIVTAERGAAGRAEVPAAVSVLTREDIEKLPAETLADLLEFLPGFHASFTHESAGTAPMVSARGFFGGGEAEYVQLRVDGVPVADPESGLADWRRIRASDIERVEALRGPGSSLYGDTALGGVIEVFTRGAPAAGTAARLSASAGSFATSLAEGSFAAGSGRWSGRISGHAVSTGGERAHAGGDEQGVDAATSWRVPGGAWTLALGAARRRREDPGALTREEAGSDPSRSDPLFRFDRDESRRGRIALSFAAETGPVPFRIAVSAQARAGLRVRSDLLTPGIADRARRDLDTSGWAVNAGADRRLRLLGRESRLRAGLEVSGDALDGQYRAVDSNGATGPPQARASGSRDKLALYFLQDWRATERVRVTAGVRWDRIADRSTAAAGVLETATRQAWSPRAGVNVRLGPLSRSPVSLFAQVSSAFKAPTLDQLFDPRPFPDFQGGTFTVSNPTLRPQRAKTIEVGASARSKSLFLDVTAYRTAVDDEIDFDPATFRYGNIGGTLHRGIETSARGRVGPLTPFASWELTRVEAREGSEAGRQLKNVPTRILRAGVGADVSGGFRVLAAANRMAGRFADDANRFPLRNAVMLDVRVERDFGPLTARLDLWNLADARTDEIGFVLPDFRGGSVPYVYPGARRAARLALDWKR